MASSSRAALLTKMHQVLKKHYKPLAPPAERSLLDHLLYAACLENASYDRADEAFAKLEQKYFDWNEVRVTTVGELAEVLARLPDPRQAAANLKQTLQSVFETHYEFDVEPLKKQTQGKAIAQLEKYKGVSPFAVAYATQHALGGHAIPVDTAALETLAVLGIISESERDKRQAPGLERTIPKNKGVEFASLLHQAAAEYHASPFSQRVRGILAEIDPEVKSRFPKRAAGKSDEEESGAESRSGEAPAAPEEATLAGKKDSPGRKKSARPPAKKTASKKLSKRKPR